jgi:hypothetical protein
MATLVVLVTPIRAMPRHPDDVGFTPIAEVKISV